MHFGGNVIPIYLLQPRNFGGQSNDMALSRSVSRWENILLLTVPKTLGAAVPAPAFSEGSPP